MNFLRCFNLLRRCASWGGSRPPSSNLPHEQLPTQLTLYLALTFATTFQLINLNPQLIISLANPHKYLKSSTESVFHPIDYVIVRFIYTLNLSRKQASSSSRKSRKERRLKFTFLFDFISFRRRHASSFRFPSA